VHLTRRHLLATTGLAGVAACTAKKVAPLPKRIDPDVALRAAAVTREQVLLAAYDAALAARPAVAAALAPLRDDHVAHLAALQASSATVAPTPAPTATPVPAPAPATTSTPLAHLERTTAAAHAAAALLASRELAPVLASLAACESSHVGLL
jgi:hypothetical protein